MPKTPKPNRTLASLSKDLEDTRLRDVRVTKVERQVPGYAPRPRRPKHHKVTKPKAEKKVVKPKTVKKVEKKVTKKTTKKVEKVVKKASHKSTAKKVAAKEKAKSPKAPTKEKQLRATKTSQKATARSMEPIVL
jgi:hypothetical protein